MQDFHESEAHFLHVALSRPHEPCVDEAQEHHVIGHFHAMPHEVAEFTPRRVGDYPVHRFRPRHEVRSIVYFAFIALPVESADERLATGTRLKDSPAWSEVIHNQARGVIGGIDSVISTIGSKRTRRPNKAMDLNTYKRGVVVRGWLDEVRFQSASLGFSLSASSALGVLAARFCFRCHLSTSSRMSSSVCGR